jgi:hypothetical protein
VSAEKVNFATFFLLWADQRAWKVPAHHWEVVEWLDRQWELGVLRVFRGGAKSTILGVYNAYRYYRDPAYRILHQSESDGTAYKTSRDTMNVLQRHPLTRDLFREGGVESWWVHGADDSRNASMYARGILSNVTSARCDEAQNDDIEVPKNIRTPEAREQLEYRLGEQTFILVPGGRQLFVGTPHTHDSIYDKMEAMGADCLTIPLFAQEHRIDDAKQASYALPFVPGYVFRGIGAGAKLLEEGTDYQLQGSRIVFATAPGGLIDCYAGCAWPERFTRADMEKRRRKTKTVNYWDSQYQLHSRPVHQIRLDPNRIIPYEVEPRITMANGACEMWLGNTRIVSCSLRWDPSSGKVNSDISAVMLDLQDAHGRHYWHRALALTGEIAKTSDDGRTIVEGQVLQLCDLVRDFQVPRVVLETNGIGKFAPNFLRMAFKQRRLACGITEVDAVSNKNTRILEAIEPVINSGMLWAHTSVLDGPLWDQMKDWNPEVRDQPDDLLDAGAGALTDQPVRVGKLVAQGMKVGNPTSHQSHDWRPDSGTHEVELVL